MGVALERQSGQLRPPQVQGAAQRPEGDRRSLPRGLVVLSAIPGPGFEGSSENSAEASYYTWVDQHNTLGLGENIPMSTANLNDGFVALKDGKMVMLRIPYPMGFYAKGFDGRIDDPNAGWKGRGLWSTNGDRTPWLMEGGKGSKPRAVHIQLRPGSPGAVSAASCAAHAGREVPSQRDCHESSPLAARDVLAWRQARSRRRRSRSRSRAGGRRRARASPIIAAQARSAPPARW